MAKIDKIKVRMYRMGTGDCFVLKFMAGTDEKYKMMIDCGTWSGSSDKLSEYVENIKTDVDNKLDLLVITHEHKDHVYGFEACKEMFTENFEIARIWMGWTENEQDPTVKKWQNDFGDKKKGLALASKNLAEIANKSETEAYFDNQYDGKNRLAAYKTFADAISDFNTLHNSISDGQYVGGLKGMEILKKQIAKDNVDFYGPGDIVENIPSLDGIKFYILGPPKSWEGEVNVDTGGLGESYQHNKKLAECDSFAAAALSLDEESNHEDSPFEDYFNVVNNTKAKEHYDSPHSEWRKIDNEWLNSTGNFALRINSITNNLSLAFAIEFEDSGKVLLFPGDAEYGSWKSWHKIPWNQTCRNGKPHFTEDLLSRTIFYKVAHHLSHNGTAERLGMEMMTHPDLVAMATLDYKIISPKWKNTMPNKGLIKALIKQTKGRVIIMNESELFYDAENVQPLGEKIKTERASMSPEDQEKFKQSFDDADPLYFEFTVEG